MNRYLIKMVHEFERECSRRLLEGERKETLIEEIRNERVITAITVCDSHGVSAMSSSHCNDCNWLDLGSRSLA